MRRKLAVAGKIALGTSNRQTRFFEPRCPEVTRQLKGHPPKYARNPAILCYIKALGDPNGIACCVAEDQINQACSP